MPAAAVRGSRSASRWNTNADGRNDRRYASPVVPPSPRSRAHARNRSASTAPVRSNACQGANGAPHGSRNASEPNPACIASTANASMNRRARREPRPSREPSSRDRSAQHITTPSTYRASKATSIGFMSSPSPKGAAGIGRTTRPASPSAAARRNENRMATHGAPGTCRTTRPASPSAAARRNENRMATHGAPGTCRTCPRPRGTGTCRISGTSAWPVPGPVSGIGRTTRPRDGSSASRIPGSGADPPSDGTGRTTCRRHGPGAYGISDRSRPARSGGVSRRRA